MCQAVWKNADTSKLEGIRSALLTEMSEYHTYHYSHRKRALEGSMGRRSTKPLTLCRYVTHLLNAYFLPAL